MFGKEAMEKVAKGAKTGEPVAGPFDVQILPLTNCNLSCAFCPLHTGKDLAAKHAPRFLKPPQTMSWELFERIVSGLRELGDVERVHFTGGEPLLHPKISEMVAAFKQNFKNVSVGVVTNGILLGKKIDALVEAGVDRINVSLNAGDAKSFAGLAPQNKKEDFTKIVESLKKTAAAVKNRKTEISISCVLTNKSYDSVEKLFEFAKIAGAKSLTFLPLTPFEYGGEKSNKNLVVTEKQFDIFMADIKKAYSKAQKAGVWIGYGGKPDDKGLLIIESNAITRCYAGFSFIVFWPDGEVRPCCNCEAIMGDILRHSLKEIWHSLAYRSFRKQAISGKLDNSLQCSCSECGYFYENTFFSRMLSNK